MKVPIEGTIRTLCDNPKCRAFCDSVYPGSAVGDFCSTRCRHAEENEASIAQARREAQYELSTHLHRWNEQVKQAFLERGIVHYRQEPEDLLRYLNWKVWTLRYGVPLNWIVGHILQYFEKAREGKGNTLGIGSAALTGATMEQFLREHLLQEYPNGENIKLLAARTRERVMGEKRRAIPEQQRICRAWRGNPWR